MQPVFELAEGAGDYNSGNAFIIRYSGMHEDKAMTNYHLLGLAVVFGVFGGLHCIPWNFPFPSEFLRITWRATSMFLIISPMVTLIIVRTGTLTQYTSGGRYRYTAMIVVATIGVIFGVLYALARIGLLVEAAYLLRDMPDSALHAVDWMYFLPHI